MKKLIAACSLLFAPLFAFAAAEVGAPAPDFSLKSADGKEVKLSDYAGKNVILEWTNHECPFVVKHYGSGNMQNLQAKYTGKDVVWLSIISSAPGKQGFVDAAKAQSLTQERNAKPSAVLFDPSGEVGKAYDAKTTPHMYIVNKAGELVYAGGIDSIQSANPEDIKKADNYVEMAMAEVLAGKEVSKSVTRPYGCSVKYK
jgi:peroxiredoxin